MPPADSSDTTIPNARQLLFTAIEEGRFESIPQLAADYKQKVQVHLSKSQNATALLSLQALLTPLTDAIQLLQIVRAHQSAQFQKLAVRSLYPASVPLTPRGSLRLDA